MLRVDVALVPAATADGGLQIGFLRVDALSAVFLLATGFLYAATAGYASATCVAKNRPSTCDASTSG